MLDGVLLLWFILTGLALIFVIWDSITNTPVSWVQKLAWILVTAYTGPIGLFLYMLSCRNPGPRLHGVFTLPHWKQAVNSEMHCLAGDATGIILAAFVVFYFGLPNGIDLIFEYLSAFVVGLFVFQALMMKAMYGDYATAVRKTFFAETVSMNMVMVGMIPAMVILRHHLGGDDPMQPLFWFVMGMAAIAGGVTAYPDQLLAGAQPPQAWLHDPARARHAGTQRGSQIDGGNGRGRQDGRRRGPRHADGLAADAQDACHHRRHLRLPAARRLAHLRLLRADHLPLRPAAVHAPPEAGTRQRTLSQALTWAAYLCRSRRPS